MNKKILLFGIVFAAMCTSLTGCTIQLDDGDIETFEKIKDATNITLNGNTISTNEINNEVFTNEINNEASYGEYVSIVGNYEEPRVQYSHINLGNSYYIVVYGHDEYGNTTWTYETERAIYTENFVTEYLGDYHNEVVYVLDNGKIVCLDVEDGSKKWELADKFILSPYYSITENGNLNLIYGENLTDFLAVNTDGKVLADFNLTSYNKDLDNVPGTNWIIEEYDNEINMIGSSEAEDSRKWLVIINLENFNVTAKEILHQPATKGLLMGKMLDTDYGDSYMLNEDGTFEYYSGNTWIDKYSVLRQSGTWEFKNNKLTLNFTSEAIVEGGHYEYDSEFDQNVLVDWDEKEISINEERVYENVRYYPDYNGSERIELDYELYYISEPMG